MPAGCARHQLLVVNPSQLLFQRGCVNLSVEPSYRLHGARAAHELSASLFDASEDCVKVVGLDGRLLDMNANGICLMEVDDFAALRGKPWASLWPEGHREKIETAIAEAGAGRGSKFVADCPTAKGTMKSWEVVVWPVLDASGKPTQMVSISRDITERLRVEADNALLTRELAHRIQNMFAVVDGVIGLSARGALESKPFADALRRRIVSLGRAIAYVLPSAMMGREETDATRSLHGLLRVLLEPYGDLEGAGRRIELGGDDVPVGRAATTSLALAVNELATNALKYGALQHADGRVVITTTRQGDVVEVRWDEQGAPRETAPAARGETGFGSILLDNAVTRQLSGQLTRDWGDGGLLMVMQLPLERLAR